MVTKDLKYHLALSVIAIVLLWTSSLTACRALARSRTSVAWLTNGSNSLSAELQFLGQRLSRESNRYKSCVIRQFELCAVSLESNHKNERIRMNLVLNSSLIALERVVAELDQCQQEYAAECNQILNLSSEAQQTQATSEQIQSRQIQRRINETEEANRRQQDAFWGAVDCVRPNGPCSNAQSMSDQISDMVKTFAELHNFDLSSVTRYNQQVQDRVQQAESFIDSVRAISDNLAAIGINLGIPGRRPPLFPLMISSFPLIDSAQEMFAKALAKPLAIVQQKQNETDAKLTILRDEQMKQLESLLANKTNQSKIILDQVNNASKYIQFDPSKGLQGPPQLVFTSANATSALEKMTLFESIIERILTLGDVAVSLDTIYRVYRSVLILANAVSSTKLNAMAYDGTVILDGRDGVGRAKRRFDKISSGWDSSWLLGLILAGVFVRLIITSIYQPLMNDFATGCVEDSTNSTSALVSNANSITLMWTTASGQREREQRALSLQMKASEICFDESFAVSESRYRIDKSFRDKYHQVASGPKCAFNATSTSGNDSMCEDNVAFMPAINNQPEGVFQCDVLLANCSLSCAGPNIELVKAATKRYVCALQGSFQSSFAVGLIAFTVFVCINVARILLINGILKIVFAVRMSQARMMAGEDRVANQVRPIIWRCNVLNGELASLGDPANEDGKHRHLWATRLRIFFEREDQDDRFAGWTLIHLSALTHLLWIWFVSANF